MELTILGMVTDLLSYYKYNFGVQLCLLNGKSNLLCSVDGLESYHTTALWRTPTWLLIMRWAYSTLEHVYCWKWNKSGARSFSHIAGFYQWQHTIIAVVPWLGQQQHWQPSVPILNTYPSLRWHGNLSTWCTCRNLGTTGAWFLNKIIVSRWGATTAIPPITHRIQTYMLSTLTILPACTAHADAWVDGMLSHYYQMTTSKVGQQSSVGIANSYKVDDSHTKSTWGVKISTSVQTSPGVPHSFPESGYRVSFTKVKWPGRGADHPPHLALRFKKEQSYRGADKSSAISHCCRRNLVGKPSECF